MVAARIGQQPACDGGASHAGHHEAGEYHAVLQVLAIGAECGRPQEHKCVHAGLKQRLHCPQQGYLWVCMAQSTLSLHVHMAHGYLHMTNTPALQAPCICLLCVSMPL